MSRSEKRLRKRQLDVIEEIFSGKDERAVLEKHKVSGVVYRKWLDDKVFRDELSFRMASSKRQSAFIISRYAPVAAAKLVSLTESEKEETARKACLDIISLPVGFDEEGIVQEESDKPAIPERFSPEVTSKLLNFLVKGGEIESQEVE